MGLSQALTLCGGLALFLYGMHMMSGGLEAAAGDKMKSILEKLTSNTFMGVLVGAGITAVVQSSSATTVMLVGFVNSGLMQLSQAVGVIMGANIGTTVTGLLIALDVKQIAPIIAFLGVCLVVFFKNEKLNHWGEIIAGLGVLFIGMDMMGSAMVTLRDSQMFIDVITKFQNPFIGVLAGTVFTALIQSSSASVGILQALAVSGVVGLDNGIYVLFGFTIGTCVTAAIASIGTSVNARRTTIIHLLFNVIGTAIFMGVCQIYPFVDNIISIFPNSPSAQIANAHLIFKVVTTIILFPFANMLVKLSILILPDKKGEALRPSLLENAKHFSNHGIGNTAIIIASIKDEVAYMYDIAKLNVELSFNAVLENTLDFDKSIRENEDKIDKLNAQISQYISTVISMPMPPHDSAVISGFFRIVGNIERIGDHSMNLAGYVRFLKSKDMPLTNSAVKELSNMKKIVIDALHILDEDVNTHATSILIKTAQAEQRIDDVTEEYRLAQLERMKTTTCTAEASVIYSEMLTDIERLGDHMLNIAEDLSKMYG